MADDFEVTEPIHVNADRTKVVPEDSPEAAFLLAVPGDRIPHDQAERLGLRKSGDAGPEPAEPVDAGAGAETVGGAEADAGGARTRAGKAVKQASVEDKALGGPTDQGDGDPFGEG